MWLKCSLVENMEKEDIASAVIIVKNKISNFARQVDIFE